MKKRILYAFWGHLADRRVKHGKRLSAPNGNAIYSWSIIREFQKRGYDVWRGMPDRDREYVHQRGKFAFASFSTQERWQAYTESKQVQFDDQWHALEWPDVDLVFLEWRFPIPGRNIGVDQHNPEYDPDLFIQEEILHHYRAKGTPIIAFDLDLQLTKEDEEKVDWVFELGFSRGPEHHLDPMFAYQELGQFQTYLPTPTVAYIGNRYNRDQQFQKYLGAPLHGVSIKAFGNWLEKDRDSAERWPHITFGTRVHPEDFHEIYMQAACVPLILMNEYNQYGWMTFRYIETLLFGSVPILPVEFQARREYVPETLRISSSEDVQRLALELSRSPKKRRGFRNKIMRMAEFTDTYYLYKQIHRFL